MAKKLRLRVLTGSDLSTARVSYAEVSSGVPATRADCPPLIEGQHRRCPFVRCRHHLALLIGDERAGRRHEGRTPLSTIRMLPPGSAVCTLDVADAVARSGEPMPIADVGAALGIKESKVHEDLARALAKLRASGFELELDAFPQAGGFSYPG